MRHRILLCMVDLTPQIITETLYALTQQRGERVDEIRVITTLGGRDRIRQALLDPQHGKFFAFCHDYHIGPARITFDETTITLLRSPEGRHIPGRSAVPTSSSTHGRWSARRPPSTPWTLSHPQSFAPGA